MGTALYQKLVDDLESNEINVYLQNDPFVVLKIKEIMDYVLKYGFLPTRKLHFQCQNMSMLDWVDAVGERTEPLFQDFHAFICQYKVCLNGSVIWEYKYEEFYRYVLKNHKCPKVFEASFFDGTDMYKWFNTQQRRMEEKVTKCLPLNQEQTLRFHDLVSLLNSFETKKFTNRRKLQELYDYLIEHQNLRYLKNVHFSDGSSMYHFFEKIEKDELDLSDKEKALFHKIVLLDIRIYKDGLQGIIKYENKNLLKSNYKSVKSPRILNSHFSKIPESGQKRILLNEMSIYSYMVYFRKITHLTVIQMAELLGMNTYHYIKLENGVYPFVSFRKMQFMILIERLGFRDLYLDAMHNKLLSSIDLKDSIHLPFLRLIAMFSFDKEKKLTPFFQKYANNDIPKKKFTITKQITLLNELETLESQAQLLEDENIALQSLKSLLQQNIYREAPDDYIIQRTNISLGLPCSSNPSIYGFTEEKARELLETYEMYKIDKALNSSQVAVINKCSSLLMCVLNPGTSLEFEVLRLKEVLNITLAELAGVFGLQASTLSHGVHNKRMSSYIMENIFQSLDKLDVYGNPSAVQRFQSCFLEAKKLDLKRN